MTQKISPKPSARILLLASTTASYMVYVLGPSGEQMTEMTNNSGTWQWAHTNVMAPGLSATYDVDLTGQTEGKLYFHLADWLGTRRQQTDYAGNPVLNFTGLPYGDGLATIPVSTADAADATEHHFTGKERDSESGNDYFGARYYASSMGRFMSPDWAESPTAVPYASYSNPQTLNLYGYMRNNPLAGVDEDGHFSNGLLAPLPEPWICFDCLLFGADRGAWNQKHPILNKILVALNPGANCPRCQIGMIPIGPGGDAALAGSTLAGFSSDELVIANELISQGNTVVKIEESTVPGVKTADALVSGVKTEFKTVTASGETSVKNAIETASKQNTQNILINARNSNLTAGQVQQQIARAQGNVGGLTGRVTVWTKEGTVRF
jgi:RHS repeat-associated protein